MISVFDIGGTKMRLAISGDGNKLLKEKVMSTPAKFKDAMSLIEESFKSVTAKARVKSVGGGVAGMFDAKRSRLIYSPNLADWIGKPLRKSLEEITGTEVFLENDAAMAGLGEAKRGAGKGNKIVSYLTIGTGVGGARIVEGKIDAKAFGFEPGHQVIDMDSSSTGRFTDLEGLVSGAGITRRFGVVPENLKGDKIWDQIARLLAYGVNNTVCYWSPDVVVLGGGLINEDVISVAKVKSYLEVIMRNFPRVPEVKKSKLGDRAGLIGSLQYLNSMN